MACIVEVRDIRNFVKQELLDIDGVRPTPSGVFQTYDITRPDTSSVAFRDKIKQLRKTYQEDAYGTMFHISREEGGVRVDIKPSQALADAMTKQNFEDDARQVQQEDAERSEESYEDDYLFSSRRGTQEPFQGNNYVSYILYKKDQITKIDNEISKLNITLKSGGLGSSVNVRKVNDRIKALETQRSIISRQLEGLSTNNPEYMFHAIIEDLGYLEQTLKSDNLIDVNKVSNTVEFYNEFISGKSTEYKGEPLSEYGNENFNFITGKVKELESLADSKSNETARRLIENSSAVQNLIENNLELSIDSLFQAQKDLTWFETWTLGVTSDRRNNTVIPQSLYRTFRSVLSEKQATIEDWNKQLYKLVKDNPELDNPEFIKEKDENGKETGFIVNLFSPKYYKAMVGYKKALNSFIEEPTSENYNNLMDQMLKHNNAVDFTRIRAVRDLYGETYADYFVSSEEQIDAYEESLKKGLGPRYEEVVNQILNRLALFEEKKQDAIATNSEYFARDLATQNIWEFNKIVRSPNRTQKIKYLYNGEEKQVLFQDFNNVTILPKATERKTIQTPTGRETVDISTGYYSEEFKKIIEDPSKLEYWKLIRQMSEYIASTYDEQTYGRLSYPKVQREYAERLQQGLKDKNFGRLFGDTAHEFKSWFYERGRYNKDNKTVISNYNNSFQREVRELAKAYIVQGYPKEDAYTKARQELLDTYSDDFNSNMIAVAMEAALHDARLETQPIAEASIRYFKSIDPDRKNAIAKLEHFYEKIILNSNEKYRDSGRTEGTQLSENTWLNRMLALLEKVPYIKDKINEKNTYLLSDTEAKIFEELTKAKNIGTTKADYSFKYDEVDYIQHKGITYQKVGEEIGRIDKAEFDRLLQLHIQEKIDNLGLDLNLAGVINGILKTTIFKGLALNPISGIFNRIEGKHSAMIMDATGEYWTTGNIDVANNIMMFANITKLSKGRLSPLSQAKRNNLDTFNQLVKQFNILQDRKNELQRSAEEARFDRELANPFIWAVENPEYKNQGAILLAVLMDKMVTDINGNTVPFLNKETQEFSMYEPGTTTLKPEFRTEENVEAYENFKGENIGSLVIQMTDAVSRSQGNYDSLDIMMAKKSIWGRAGTLFMTWFAEHLNQRFGISGDSNYNLATGKKRRDGRFVEAFRANKVNTSLAAATGLAVSYGIGGPLLLAAGFGGLGFMVYKKYIGGIAGSQQNKREINHAMELVEFTKSLLIESLNYPGRILNVHSKLQVKNNTFEGTTMTKEEVQAMRALTRELAIVLSWLAVKLAMGALMYDDDDDKDSAARKRFNFVQNQLSRTINSLTVYSNPQELITDQSRIAALETVSTAGKILLSIYNEKQREDLGKNFLSLSPVPRILTKGELPWHDKMNYDDMSNFTGIPSPMKWTSDFFKNYESDGAHSAEQEYREILANLREEAKSELISKHDGKKKPLKKEVDDLIKKKINGYKKHNQSYEDKLEELDKLGLR